MKKILLLVCWILPSMLLFAQNHSFNYAQPETYVNVTVNKAQLQYLSLNFSVDAVHNQGDGTFQVTICVGDKEYAAFEATGIPYTIAPAPKPTVNMANSYAQLIQQWNRYPTYNTYLATMDTFRSQFPQLCEIDTILSQTPNNHSILVAHISNNLQDRGDKPAFFYTSTIHGDEPVGYYMMIRLIYYLLHNYATDPLVQELVDNVDIWICPIENPDGTYYSSNNSLNSSPYSTRYNYNGVDLNRSYPLVGGYTAMRDLEPEVQAMINFGSARQFTMSANLHGGAEVFNYPWDYWTSNQRPHADDNWWNYVGHKFADTCQQYSSQYMNEENDGVTEGGDWYVITGSRQDYYNYYLQCREATIEVGDYKVLPSSYLPYYWGYIYHSFLNYMEESLYGFRGVVTDTVTGQPLEATVVVENHDDNVSFVSSRLPMGDYHRPIKGGTYQVTFSATGYFPKTLTLTATDAATLVQDVQLVPLNYDVDDHSVPVVEVYPNPVGDLLNVKLQDAENEDVVMRLYDAAGRLVSQKMLSNSQESISMKDLAPGMYLLRISRNGKTVCQQKVVHE